MMIETATVLHYQDGIAKIQCLAKNGCGGCNSTGCGTKSLSALTGEKNVFQLEIAVSQELKQGDIIEIGIAENHLLLSVFWLYAIPLIVLMMSTLIFSVLFENELFIAVGLLCCTSTAFFCIKKIIKRQKIAGLFPIFMRKL